MGLVSNDDGWRMPASLWGRIEPLIPKPKVAGSRPVVRFPGLAVSRTFSRKWLYSLAGPEQPWSRSPCSPESRGRILVASVAGDPRTEAARLQAARRVVVSAVAGSNPVAHPPRIWL